MKNKKIRLALASILAMSLLFTACSEESSAPEPQTLVIQDASPWEGIDLYQCSSWNDIQGLVADPIFEKDPVTGEMLPGIASAYEWSDDGLTWTITFPEGMYYSTGEQVEPEDFIASVEWGREVSGYASGYSNIESMAVDGRNVVVTLSSYAADMEYNFMGSFTGLFDKDELETMSKDELLWGAHPYGEYYVESYEPGAHATLKVNEKYITHNPLVENKNAPLIKDVKVVFSGESFTHAEGIKNGEYDVLTEVPSEYYEDLVNSPEVTVFEASGASLNYAELNLTDPILQDIDVRTAIIKGINRDNLASYIPSYNKVAYSLILSKCLNYSEEAVDYYMENYDYDLEGAKKLLADAGWADSDGDGFLDKDGTKLAFTFSARDDEQSTKIAQSVQIDLKAIGIDMQITTQDWSYVNQAVVDGNFQMAYLVLGWSEPFLLMERFCLRNAEATNPDPDLQIEMVADARLTVDYEERTEKITELQKHIMDYATLIPFVDNNSFAAHNSEIKGIVTTPTGGFFLNDVVVDENGQFKSAE